LGSTSVSEIAFFPQSFFFPGKTTRSFVFSRPLGAVLCFPFFSPSSPFVGIRGKPFSIVSFCAGTDWVLTGVFGHPNPGVSSPPSSGQDHIPRSIPFLTSHRRRCLDRRSVEHPFYHRSREPFFRFRFFLFTHWRDTGFPEDTDGPLFTRKQVTLFSRGNLYHCCPGTDDISPFSTHRSPPSLCPNPCALREDYSPPYPDVMSPVSPRSPPS